MVRNNPLDARLGLLAACFWATLVLMFPVGVSGQTPSKGDTATGTRAYANSWWNFTDSDGEKATCKMRDDQLFDCEPSSHYRDDGKWRVEGSSIYIEGD